MKFYHLFVLEIPMCVNLFYITGINSKPNMKSLNIYASNHI